MVHTEMLFILFWKNEDDITAKIVHTQASSEREEAHISSDQDQRSGEVHPMRRSRQSKRKFKKPCSCMTMEEGIKKIPFSPVRFAEVFNFRNYRDRMPQLRRAHHTLHMASDAAHTAMTAAFGGITIATTPAIPTDAQEAITGLPDHLVVTHVLRSEYFDDPADLARLPAVSRGMRDAVAATGLQIEELDEDEAVNLGCLSALQRRQRQGRLSRQEYLCQAAARSGQLEELKALRENGTPWGVSTCWAAAMGGRLDVLQWAHVNDCPWNEETCAAAAVGGHLKVLQWARANDCPWNENTCHDAAMGGHIEVLLWACANGCPCDKKELHIAAQEGHEAMVRALIEAGADINKAKDNGATLLCIAASEGHESVMQVLIELGADTSKAMDGGATPLFIATQNGHETVMQVLIELGADVNKAIDGGATPLFVAAQNGHETMVRALIEAGADVNPAKNILVTPLLMAAQKGHEAVVRALIEAKRTSTRQRITARRRCASPLKRATRW